MALPLSYNWRNLVARKTTTIMTALGIGLTVAVLLSTAAVVEGLQQSLRATAHPLNILVLRKGATAELSSTRSPEEFQVIRSKRGLATGADGQPLAALELVTVIVLENEAIPAGINITVRGISPSSWELRDGLRLAGGRRFQPGRREVVVGKNIAERYPMARIGQKLVFGRGAWEVVGVFDGGRSAINSEILCDINQLASDLNRAQALSSVLIRAQDEVAKQALINDITEDRRLNATAISEAAYYEQQTSSAAPIRYLGIFVAAIMAIGSCFAAMNTMYAAVARRSSEIGTLRVLGFSRYSVLISFLLESLLLSLLGGLVGCLLVAPLNNLQTGLGNFVTFSEITFELRITPPILLTGLGFALVMGSLGGVLPAASAARKQILDALRQV
ncbi:MAG: ABC transporter permease [Bryobacteraceae bacterium]|nr:ABC transporter permease [Bryobacteraceae bacterium]MDW8378178.1 ABC transporter permease [Bryobacterales bacterium]